MLRRANGGDLLMLSATAPGNDAQLLVSSIDSSFAATRVAQLRDALYVAWSMNSGGHTPQVQLERYEIQLMQ